MEFSGYLSISYRLAVFTNFLLLLIFCICGNLDLSDFLLAVNCIDYLDDIVAV